MCKNIIFKKKTYCFRMRPICHLLFLIECTHLNRMTFEYWNPIWLRQITNEIRPAERNDFFCAYIRCDSSRNVIANQTDNTQNSICIYLILQSMNQASSSLTSINPMTVINSRIIWFNNIYQSFVTFRVDFCCCCRRRRFSVLGEF